MSECVVRMKMPTENTVCELNYYFCFREWRCAITDKRCDHNKNGMFPSWCHIICQLPEGHGRLVEAKALFERVYEYYGQDNEDNENWMMEMINGAPTIVPAEAERSET